jgi:hypothetical protein
MFGLSGKSSMLYDEKDRIGKNEIHLLYEFNEEILYFNS